MKKFLIAIFTLLISTNAIAACEQLVAFGFPVDSELSHVQLCRNEYVVSYSTIHKIPIWTAEHLLKSNLTVAEKRINAFKQDPDLDAKVASTLADYKASGYDRGHMSPAGDFRNSDAMLQSFYLSNIVPQVKENNRGIWKILEERVREVAIAREDLYVITGAVVTDSKTIGAGVAVPSQLFKIILDKKTGEMQAYLLPNKALNVSDLSQYILPLSKLETLTKIKFFPASHPALKEVSYPLGR